MKNEPAKLLVSVKHICEYLNIYIDLIALNWTKYTAVRLGGSKSAAAMKMKIYTYIYICTDDLHIMLCKVAFFPCTYTIVCRVQNCVEICLFIVCLVRLFSHFRRCKTFNRLVQPWTDSSWESQYIYIYVEVQRWTRKGMYQKQCSWMDNFCVLVDMGGKGCIYVYIYPFGIVLT